MARITVNFKHISNLENLKWWKFAIFKIVMSPYFGEKYPILVKFCMLKQTGTHYRNPTMWPMLGTLIFLDNL